jgi:hypothetical protein
VAFAQKGKAGGPTLASTPSDASAEKSVERKPHPAPGKKDMVGKMIANAVEKKNCFNCSMDYHWVVNCPNLTAAQRKELSGMAHISVGKDVLNGIGFLQNKSTNAAVITTRKTLNPHRLYLDSTSSFHQVFTDKHLDHLKMAVVTLHADCNAGNNFATKKGWFQDLFHLWLVRNGIANLLSPPQLEDDSFTISYHTGGNWIITTPQGKDITFHREPDGICHGFPYLDKHSELAVAMLQTICKCYKGFTQRKVRDAIFARKAQAMTGHPSDAQFQTMISNNSIKNCPIRPKHTSNAHSIFGPSIAGVQGKTVCRPPKQVEAAWSRIPDDYHHLHKFVVLTADVMFVNGFIFLATLSQKMRLATAEQLPTCTARQLNSSLTKIVRLYAHTGFIIKVVMMDQEFNKVEDEINLVEINTTAAHEHIGEIKQFIRVIKERSRALVSDLPYTTLPRQDVIYLVYFAILWLNSLPVAAGVSERYSPRKIVLRHKLDFAKHSIALFGSYVKAHDNPTITNTMHPCTFIGIFLHPTGNRQGSHKVFDINTGVVKKPCTVTLLPMPDRVIKVVNDWGCRHAKEDITYSLTFLNHKKEL